MVAEKLKKMILFLLISQSQCNSIHHLSFQCFLFICYMYRRLNYQQITVTNLSIHEMQNYGNL